MRPAIFLVVLIGRPPQDIVGNRSATIAKSLAGKNSWRHCVNASASYLMA
jgi:hypothetical protein